MNKEVHGELIPATDHLPPAFGGQLPKSLIELRPIVENAFEAWLKRTESKATRVVYRNDVMQFLEFHGIDTEQLEQMTRMVPDDVTSWRDHLLAFGGRKDKDGNATPAPNSTVARKITAIRSFFSFLQVGGHRGGNPAHPRPGKECCHLLQQRWSIFGSHLLKLSRTKEGRSFDLETPLVGRAEMDSNGNA